MSVDFIRHLQKFDNIDNVDNACAFFQTRVPQVAEMAYLNIIFKPAPEEVLSKIAEELMFPDYLRALYSRSNGANMFLGNMVIYGCLPATYQINRTDFLARLPFDIRAVNREFERDLCDAGLLCVGSYGFDRSLVCIERTTGRVVCFEGEDLRVVRKSWVSIVEWLTSEIERLKDCFSSTGMFLLEDEEMTLPLAFAPEETKGTK